MIDMSMQAMLLSKLAPIEGRPLKLTSLAQPNIKKNELLVEIEACGVCRSNLHVIEGDWKKHGVPSTLPIIPGHEIVGFVKKVGDSVKKVKRGDRVGIQPLYSSCLKCEYCRNGRENLCESAEITGENVNGGYAEFIAVSEPFATKIPDDFKAEYAAPLFCPGITAYKAVKASQPNHRKTIGIFGVGGVGHIAIQFAKLENARVVAISRSKNHLKLGESVGADSSVELLEDSKQFLQNLKKEEGLLDSAIVFAPSEKAIGSAMKSVKRGGIVVVCVFGEIPEFHFYEEKIVKGSVIGTREDMRQLVRIAEESDLKVVSKGFPLKEANKVLADLKNSKVYGRAVLLP
jgi:propanol-preferring alcohol dehydrogenase